MSTLATPVYHLAASTHIAAISHDTLIAGIFAFSLSLDVLLLDFMDRTRHATHRMVT